MAWVILILVLLAAAVGVLGIVLKAAAVIVLTTLLAVAVLAAIAWYSIRSRFRAWERGTQGGSRVWIGGRTPASGPSDLPSHDDRY